MSDRTVFQRILAAAREGAGVKLSADETRDLVRVKEVRDRAYQDDAEQLGFDHLEEEDGEEE